MYVEIFGARGTYPISGKEFLNYGGNTACILINSGNTSVIIDAGTGIINLSRSRKLLKNIILLLTHYHLDHITGLPYASFLYSDGFNKVIYGPNILGIKIDKVLEFLSLPFLFPFDIVDKIPNLKLRTIENGDKKDREGFKISSIHSSSHPMGGVMTYRIEAEGKSIVVATDIEGGDEKVIKMAEGADILIHDAQYTEEEYLLFQGYGHSSSKMAAETAKKAEVKKLILFHHAPNHSDSLIKNEEEKTKKLFPETEAGFEGMKLEL